MFAPAGTPPAIVSRLQQESARALQAAETKERYLRAGMEAVGSTAEELAAIVRSDVVRLSKLIKDAGIRE
jgi:tripartite-type tricarboxylate transporter receptor subunit TctC